MSSKAHSPSARSSLLGLTLGKLYGALQGLSNAPVEFATSMVSFERVFEVIDLPVDIPEKPDALTLHESQGMIEFDNVSFKYEVGDENLLSDVHRYGSIDNVTAVLSGAAAGGEKEEEVTPHQPGSQHRAGAGQFSRGAGSACGAGGAKRCG